MLHFPSNLLRKTTIRLLSKSLFIPWGSRIAYTKGRGYSSSLPVRYVPKKLSQDEKAVASSLPKKHEGLELDVEGTEFYNGLEEALSSLHPFVESGVGETTIDGFLPEDKYMKEPDELADKDQCNLIDLSDGRYQTQASGNRPAAERLAIRILSMRALTASELRKKLLLKNFPLDIVDTVVADFQNRGYINDCLYAETYSKARFSSSCWGPNKIKQALFNKGVSKLNIDTAVKLVFEEGESVEEPELVVGISMLSMDHLLGQASKQWRRNQKVSSEKRKSRLIQWLQYRGYNWTVVGFVLKKLESGYVPQK